MGKDRTVEVAFSADQLELLGRLANEEEFGATLPEIVRNVFRAQLSERDDAEGASGNGQGVGENEAQPGPEYGARRFDTVLEPVTGRAVPVHKGEVLRISLIEGPQCIDFACFNLNDYKEYMSMGWTRGPTAEWRLGAGGVLMSKPPRFNPMMAIVEMSEGCDNTTVAIGCHAGVYEMAYGFGEHANCHETIGEAIREFGLTPDDTHDPFCLWMNASWSARGDWNPSAGRVSGKPGDHVDFLATMDVLAVPVICGGAALFAGTGNYRFKPIRVEVYEASEGTQAMAEGIVEGFSLKSRAKSEELAQVPLPSERRLEGDSAYEPRYRHHPVRSETVEVPLGAEEQAAVAELLGEGWAEDEADVVRSSVMEWYTANRMLFTFG